jgi:hypothetical protein
VRQRLGIDVCRAQDPGRHTNGTQVRYQILSSTPPTNTPSFSSYNTPADADPVAASTYMRVDTLLSANDTWVPTGTSGRIASIPISPRRTEEPPNITNCA